MKTPSHVSANGEDPSSFPRFFPDEESRHAVDISKSKGGSPIPVSSAMSIFRNASSHPVKTKGESSIALCPSHDVTEATEADLEDPFHNMDEDHDGGMLPKNNNGGKQQLQRKRRKIILAVVLLVAISCALAAAVVVLTRDSSGSSDINESMSSDSVSVENNEVPFEADPDATETESAEADGDVGLSVPPPTGAPTAAPTTEIDNIFSVPGSHPVPAFRCTSADNKDIYEEQCEVLTDCYDWVIGSKVDGVCESAGLVCKEAPACAPVRQ